MITNQPSAVTHVHKTPSTGHHDTPKGNEKLTVHDHLPVSYTFLKQTVVYSLLLLLIIIIAVIIIIIICITISNKTNS